MTTTDTPRSDACPHCGAEQSPHITTVDEYVCETLISKGGGNTKRSELCKERELHQDALLRYSEELAASKAEVERLKSDKTHLITQCANLLEELSEIKETYASIVQQPHFDEREVHCSCVPVLRAEVERLTGRMKEAEDRIKGLHDGLKKARKAHIETCKNAQREIDKLHTENVCLQELIQEFYEWSRRDFPTEQEVREIMNRYHNLLNK